MIGNFSDIQQNVEKIKPNTENPNFKDCEDPMKILFSDDFDITEAIESEFDNYREMDSEYYKSYSDLMGDEIKNEPIDKLASDVNVNVENPTENVENKGLTDDEKTRIKEETGWSDEIINSIENMDQYEIYKNAGLHEEEINGRKCLVKDIDLDYIDPKTGMTNRELMAKGRAPIDSKTGERIELHHMGQDYDSPFAELCENSEHGDGNDTILHDKSLDSWRNNPQLKNKYNNSDKPNHWKNRVAEG